MSTVDSISEALEKTRVSASGVSFAGKSLKLNSEADAKEVVEEIGKCPNLEYLNLEGNTLGVDAAKIIAKALEKHPEFKRALWKDMFTGRIKTEIPKALESLGNGLVTAGAHLVELDLSDNAFGPIGVEGLASLIRSSSCYNLEELRLNNNGLGIGGGRLLASALTDCYNSSKNQGKALALKVFIAGRNRLENDGAIALAEVFKLIGTLEEIAMPQNGIYHPGISALSTAFTHNKNLQILNLNDNTIGAKGAEAIANALPQLQKLKELNFGDCLLKTKGVIFLASALKSSHFDLEDVTLGFNEIRTEGALELVAAMNNKSKLKSLNLDGNQFGEEGKSKLEKKLTDVGKLHVLGSLDDNEPEDSENEEEEDVGEDGNETEESENEDDQQKPAIVTEVPKMSIDVNQFLSAPNKDNYLALGNDRIDVILKEAKKIADISIHAYIHVIMKISSLSNNPNSNVAESSSKCAELLYKELFIRAQQKEQISIINNSILVDLGLIKDEDKKRPMWRLDGCFYALKNVLTKNYVPETTKNVFRVFIQREIDNKTEPLAIKRELLSILN